MARSPMPRCAQQHVSTEATTCPHCGAPVTPSKNEDGSIYTIGMAVLWAIGGLVALAALGPMLPKSEERERANLKMKIVAACQIEVQGRLAAPSTAKFPQTFPRVIDKGGGFYTVISTVESQNAFGVPLRSEWMCDVNLSPGNVIVQQVNVS